MFLSDGADQSSGLARITRDLCTMLVSNPRFRVASLGYHSCGSIRLPWAMYAMANNEFGELSLPHVWSDFSRGEQGIVMSCWDISRLLWLARPEFLTDETLRQNVMAVRQKAVIWSYFPIDSTGPNDRLTAMSRETLLGLNRIVTTSPWAEGVIRRTIGDAESAARGLTWMPHAYNSDVFNPEMTAHDVRLSTDDPPVVRIGVVATNQLRKNWCLIGETCALLKREIGNLQLWFHIDVDVRHWSLPAILEDFGLTGITEVTHPPIQDKELAARYRQCDITLHPGEGEGWGFPLFESLACGVPVVHGRYASGASALGTCDLMQYTVPMIGYRYETEQNCMRPVFSAKDWAEKTLAVLKMDNSGLSEKVDHLAVKNLYYPIRRWFEDGIRIAGQ